jgi:hypothetical protein
MADDLSEDFKNRFVKGFRKKVDMADEPSPTPTPSPDSGSSGMSDMIRKRREKINGDNSQ